MGVQHPGMVGRPWWRWRAERLVDLVVGAGDAATRLLAPWRPPPPLRAGDTVEWAGPAQGGGYGPSGMPFEAFEPGMRGRVLGVEPQRRGWAASVTWDDWPGNTRYSGPTEDLRTIA